MKMPGSIGVNLRVTGHCSQGGRKYMEDFFSVAYQQSEDGKDLEYAFFGIYDGHGGSEAAIFAKEHLMNIIVRQKLFWSDNDADIRKAIYEGYLATHYAMWREQEKWPKTNSGLPSTAGTTASIAFIRHGKIYIGHVGDSGIVLGYQEEGEQFWRAKQLTQDHKPESTIEKARIMNSGGKVVIKSGVPRVVWNRPRIGHQGPVRRSTLIDEIPFLAIARSLGDLWSYNCDSDEFVVSPVPDVRVIKIDSKKFRCLIFGTDGLWNVLLPGGAVEIVRAAEHANDQSLVMHPLNEDHQSMINRQKSTKDWINPSKCLVDRALEIWSRTKMRADNTSVVTIMLDPPGPPKRDLLKAYTNHNKSAEQQQHDEIHNRNDGLNENSSTNQYYPSPYTNQNDRNFTMYDHTTKETIDIDNIPLPTSGLAIMTRYETNSNDHLESTETSSSPFASSSSSSSTMSTSSSTGSSSTSSTTTGDVMHSFTESYNSLYNSMPYDDHSYNLLYNPSITTPTTIQMNNMDDNVDADDDDDDETTAIVTDVNPINYNDDNESLTNINNIDNDENGINIEDENTEYPIDEDTYSLTSLETRQQSQMAIETPSYTDLSSSMMTTASSSAAAAVAVAATATASPSSNSSPTISFHGFNQEYTEDCIYYDHYYDMNVYERAIKSNNIQQQHNDSIPIVNHYFNHTSSSTSTTTTSTTTTTTTSSSSSVLSTSIPRIISTATAASSPPPSSSSSYTSTNAIIVSNESNPIEYEAITNSTNNNNNNDNNNISNNENLLNDTVQIYEISSSSVPISSSSPSTLSSSSSSNSNSNRKSPSILNLNIENDHKYSKSFKKCIKNNKNNIKNRLTSSSSSSRILTRSNQFERRHILRQQNNLVTSPVVGRILNYNESVKSYNTKVITRKSSSSSITPIKMDKKTVINVQPYKVLNTKYNQTIHLGSSPSQTNPITLSNTTNTNTNTTTKKSTSLLDINIIKRNQSLTIDKSLPIISSSPPSSKLSIIIDNQRVLRSKDQSNASSSSSSTSSTTSSILTRATKITNPMKHYHRLNKTSLTIKSNNTKKLPEDLLEKSSIFEKRILQENLGRSNKRNNNSKIINVIGSSIPSSSSATSASSSSHLQTSPASIISSSLSYKITRSSSRVKLRNRK